MGAPVDSRYLQSRYLLSATLYGSICAAVVLSWAQSDDLNLVTNALNFTLPLFWIALSMMSMTFMAGVYLVMNERVWLHIASLVMGVAFHFVLLLVSVQ